MAKTDVTINQMNELRRLAMSKGITRAVFQRALDVSEVPRWLEKIRNEYERVQLCHERFEVWKTVTLGLHKTPDSYEQALESAGYPINFTHRGILCSPKFSCADKETEIDLVIVSTDELGLYIKWKSHREVYARARQLGLELCPAEVGPALRLSYDDQPCSEYLNLGMEPVHDRGGHPMLFVIWNNGIRRFVISSGDSCGNGHFIFSRPRK